MKILVLSDSHNSLANAKLVLKRIHDKIEGVIHLGDTAEDAKCLAKLYPALNFYMVCGNCDYYYGGDDETPDVKILELGKQRILMAHGHQYGIKIGYDEIARVAKSKNANVVLCGHTHQSVILNIDQVLIMNPGSIAYPRGKDEYPTYGMLNILGDGDIQMGIVCVKKGGVLEPL